MDAMRVHYLEDFVFIIGNFYRELLWIVMLIFAVKGALMLVGVI